MKQSLLPGTKLFKTEEDGSIFILRAIKPIGDGKVVCKDINGKKFNMSLTELDNEFSVIKPHAYIIFVAVEKMDNMENTEDVIVMVYRREEIDGKSKLPYCICRQNITDFFTNAIDRNIQDKQHVGMSLSKDSIPEGVRMEDVLACNGIICEYKIAVYLNDTLDSMLSFIPSKTKKIFDNILYNLTQNVKRYNEKIDDLRKKGNNISKLIGYCDSLKNMLLYNDIMYDFLNGFKIYPLNIDFSFVKEDESNELPVTLLRPLSDIISKNIISGIIDEYTEFINLEKMVDDEISFFLISDIHEDIYIIKYESAGKYIPPMGNTESSENIYKLNNFYPNINNTVSNYSDLIRFNKFKSE